MNIALPSDWSFKPIVDLRERYERRIDKDFNESTNDNRGDLLSRWRVGTEFAYGKQLSGKIVYQFAHNLFWTASRNDATPSRKDIFLAYADLPTGGGKLRVGRQDLVKGNQSLLGGADWGNTARSWDMVRWTKGPVDAYFGKLGVNATSSNDARLAGLSYTHTLGETSLIYKHDKAGASHDDIYTVDHLYRRTGKVWSTNFEIAGQVGRTGDKKLEAWAVNLRQTYQASQKLKLYVEGSAASGGNRGDTTLTFDQLYATNHAKFGIQDSQGWRNMKGLTLGSQYALDKKTSLYFEIHRFGLWAADDAWYSDGGRPNRGDAIYRDATGASGKDVGIEFDFWATHNLNPTTALEAAITVFRPGRFVGSFANSGDRNQVAGHVQVRFRF